jgi:hypothetical protein
MGLSSIDWGVDGPLMSCKEQMDIVVNSGIREQIIVGKEKEQASEELIVVDI